ncbi:MAG: thiamine phosphate synthase [Eggerthellaceae bacterium]|jgi:thiamine-phosphate pyrophosphorylase
MSENNGPRQRGKWSAEDIRKALNVYAVTDRQWLGERTLSDCVKEALDGGASFVQLREKEAPRMKIALYAHALKPLCEQASVPFVIDDDVDLAKQVGADGVHIGQGDEACTRARAELGEDAIIGVSVQTPDQARAAQEAGADYLGVGAVASTSTKPEAGVLSAQEIQAICDAVEIPVVAIGGVNENTIGVLDGVDISGIAVVSAIFAADDIRAATANLVKRMDMRP